MENSIEVKELSITYREFSIDKISFTVPKGSIMGFIGQNGAGKTTTLKAILNLIKRQSGEIKILGLDNIKDERKIKEQIGVVFDESYFHDNLTIKDITKMMKNIYKNWDNNTFAKYINKFKLPQDKIVKDFSRGMKMKLSIAVALSHDPKILILDEATSGLDPIVREEILDIFLDFIQDEEHSILISSHITGDLEKVADYITFIDDGKIIFSKNKDELCDDMGIVKCKEREYQTISKGYIIRYRKNSFGYEVLVNNRTKLAANYPDMIIEKPSIEEIMLFYVRGERR